MSRPPAARDAVLDAFERLVTTDGERAATLDATARAAGVSKGGLLYHFGNRQALIDGLLARLRALVDDDVELIHAAGAGAVSYFVRASEHIDSPLDRAFIAAVRLAQAGDQSAAGALEDVRNRWIDALGEHVADPAAALAVVLVSDGLYYHSALRAEAAPGVDAAGIGAIPPERLDELVALLERLAAPPA